MVRQLKQNSWSWRWPGGYTMISNAALEDLLTDTRLSLDFRYFAAVIVSSYTVNGGELECHHPPEQIADKIGCSRAGADGALRKLLDGGYVVRWRRGIYRIPTTLAARSRWLPPEDPETMPLPADPPLPQEDAS